MCGPNFGQIVDQIFGQVFGQVFDQGFGDPEIQCTVLLVQKIHEKNKKLTTNHHLQLITPPCY